MTDLPYLRRELDGIDHELLGLFCRRMALAHDVAATKRTDGRPVQDPAREREKLDDLIRCAPAALTDEVIALFSLLMSMSRAVQTRDLAAASGTSPASRALDSLAPATATLPCAATVACQGVEGAYSQLATTRLFRVPQISFFTTFDGVARAVRDGLTQFGVLPLENSTAGSVTAVFDLLARDRLHIVRSIRLKIDHELLAKPGTKLEDIRCVVSHEQALAQCAAYLRGLNVETQAVANTAAAAAQVAASPRRDIACLASPACADLYGLATLASHVQDADGNYTRFAVVTAEPLIYPGADRTSLMLTLPHEPGALYRVLERIYALDINLLKLESRPIPGQDFQFRFYFDLACPVGAPAFGKLLDGLADVCCDCIYFGTYAEVL